MDINLVNGHFSGLSINKKGRSRRPGNSEYICRSVRLVFSSICKSSSFISFWQRLAFGIAKANRTMLLMQACVRQSATALQEHPMPHDAQALRAASC